MKSNRRSKLVYGLLLGVWVLVVAWQIEEHARVQEAARRDLRSRSTEIGNTLSAVMRALSFRGRQVLQYRLEPVLNELVKGQTNELVSSSGLISIALLNNAGEPIVAAGSTNLMPDGILAEGEYWTHDSVTFVNPIEGASVENETNAMVVLPPPPFDFTNALGFRTNGFRFSQTNFSGTNVFAGRERGTGRPPWLREMSDTDYKAFIAKRELHGLVLVMSTENFLDVSTHDFWLRCIIIFFAGISAIGIAFAWRNIFKTSELQIRLVRASELNSHLKEMNLAAAGLAHETRNPLNIIRGLAQMISRQPELSAEIREKSRVILDETDKVTAQLTEFINYSRPREVRRTRIALNAAVAEVLRTLGGDIEENKIRVETNGDPISIEADEQMLRQVLFNLLINAIQAVGQNGSIQIQFRRADAAEAVLEVSDNGTGVLPEHRQEIFKPYFTTHQKGTGLGLAVVQQIILAHGWEIECLPNQPKGAIFRITHLKLAV